MGWERDNRFPYLRLREHRSPLQPLGVNVHCFIRKEHECGKIFSASKSCFIACPSDSNIDPLLELISEKLSKYGIEPVIATRERAYGQDIFCTKICGRIIESRFCLTILDDTKKEEIYIPNPNVYYEYGLMTSLRKHIIPLQRDDLELAFNIQSYDTIKYLPTNIGPELDRAIKDAIRITETRGDEEKKEFPSEKTILRKLELNGFQEKNDNWFLWNVIEDTQFKGFGHIDKDFYLYLGKINYLQDFEDYLEDVNVVIYRTKKKEEELKLKVQELEKSIPVIESKAGGERIHKRLPYPLSRDIQSAKKEIEKTKSYISSIKTIFIAFIVKPGLDLSTFEKKIVDTVDGNKEFQIAFSENDLLKIGDISINLGSEFTL